MFFFFCIAAELFGNQQSITSQGKRWDTTNNRPLYCSSLWWKDPEERCLGEKHFTQNQLHDVPMRSYFAHSKLDFFFFTGW